MAAPASLMIFAAGFGTRMGALTADRPKPLIEVAGRPLIDHALDLTKGLPLTKVVNTHYLGDMLAAHLEGRDVHISHEPEILDTGGGLRQALPTLGSGAVFTMNADVIWKGPNPLDLLSAAWDPARTDALLMCVPLARAVGRKGGGDFSIAPDGQISRSGDLVYTGVQILKTDGLVGIPDPVFSLNRLWDQMIADGRACALEYPGNWCDVGHPEGIQLAEELIRDV